MACAHFGRSLVLVCAVVLALPGMVLAASDEWKDATSGKFGDGSRWLDGSAPTAGDTATFDVAGTYEVYFNLNPVNRALTVSDGVVTFYGTGGSTVYSLTGAGGTMDAEIIDGASLTLGRNKEPLGLVAGDDLAVNRGGTLTVDYESQVTCTDLLVGTVSGPDGEILVTQASEMTVTGGGTHLLGSGGATGILTFADSAVGDISGRLSVAGGATGGTQGYLTVASGSVVSMGNLTAGTGGVAGQQGSISVFGSGSRITQKGVSTLTLGATANSPGELIVENGGEFTTGTGTTTVRPTGSIEIDDATFNAHGDVDLDGGMLTRNTNGVFSLAAGTTLAVSNGGRATFDEGYVLDVPATIDVADGGSMFETSSGGITVAAGGQISLRAGAGLVSAAALEVGTADGNGTVSLSGGATASSVEGYLGTVVGARGQVTVDGAGSAWTVSGNLFIGDRGTGSLDLTDGATVSTGSNAVIGAYEGADGAVTVDGGSTFACSAHLSVGFAAPGTLTITNGGTVSAGSAAFSTNEAESAVAVEGKDSTLTCSGQLRVGGLAGATLDITNGGVVSCELSYVGVLGAGNGEVTVAGAGSMWLHSDFLHVGEYATGTLTVSDGGVVSNALACIGLWTGSDGAVTVTGTDSSWECTSVLYVGKQSSGALAIAAGGAVSNTNAYLGYDAGSTGAVTVDGAGSQWTCAGILRVGLSGTGTLEITHGGVVSSADPVLGYEADSNGTVLVDGADSQWSCSGEMYVGRSGTGTLTIQGGGTVLSEAAYLGFLPTSNATATVDGAGSTWTCSVMLSCGEGTLTVTNGGVVSSTYGFIANGTDSDGEVTVEGAGSRWTCSDDLYVAAFGTAELTIQGGGTVECPEGFVGYSAGGDGTVTVDGTDSLWTSSTSLALGTYGTGRLIVTNGGSVSSGATLLAREAGSEGHATVDGAGSSWEVNGDLYVGYGDLATLDVVGGGSLTSADASVGFFADGDGVVTVDGAGSTWTDTGTLIVGASGTGAVHVTGGGTARSHLSLIGNGVDGRGTATVQGSGSTWEHTGHLAVGNRGAGTLDVLDGGNVSDPNASVGDGAGGIGVVTVSGAGATWSHSRSLFVGGSADAPGGSGRVDIWTGGTVSVGETLRVWPGGVVNLYGGTLSFAREDPLDPCGGSVGFHYGTVAFDRDLMIAASNGTLTELLGSPLAISAGRELRVTGTATLLGAVILAGGTLSVGDLNNPALLAFDTGTLRLTSVDLTVGPGGLFGTTLPLGTGQTVLVDGTTTVSAGGFLELSGGTLGAGGLVNSGVIRGRGRIDAPLMNTTVGEVRVAAGERLLLTGAGNTNAGRFESLGGEIEFTQDLINRTVTGLITGRDAVLRFGGGLANEGAVALTFGVSDVFGDVDNAATGTIVLSGGGNATFYDDVDNDGEVRVSAGSTAVFLGALAGNGTTGTGTVYAEGDLRPGHSAGIMAFGGDVHLRSTTDLKLELADANNADPLAPRYDALAVAGDVELSGMLSLDWLPVDGDATSTFGGVYTVLVYGGSRTGAFDGVACQMAAYLDESVFEDGIEYDDANGLVKVHLYDLLAGDADLDGVVGRDDFLAMEAGSALADPTWLDGDFTFDGAVSAADYLLWKAHVGSSVPGAVPAPATALLLVAGAAAGLGRRGRRRTPGPKRRVTFGRPSCRSS